MKNSSRRLIKRWTLIVGITILTLGIGFPLLQELILPAASSLGGGIFLLFIFSVSLPAGLIGLALGLLRPIGESISAVRALFLGIGGMYSIFLLYIVGNLFWHTFVGPSAEIVIPNEFEGHFLLTIQAPLNPSIQTAGQHYVYQIPKDGNLQLYRGWIGLSFSFEEGVNIPGGRYYTQIVRQNGELLHNDEFECTWMSSMQAGTGIDCDIQPFES